MNPCGPGCPPSIRLGLSGRIYPPALSLPGRELGDIFILYYLLLCHGLACGCPFPTWESLQQLEYQILIGKLYYSAPV